MNESLMLLSGPANTSARQRTTFKPVVCTVLDVQLSPCMVALLIEKHAASTDHTAA